MINIKTFFPSFCLVSVRIRILLTHYSTNISLNLEYLPTDISSEPISIDFIPIYFSLFVVAEPWNSRVENQLHVILWQAAWTHTPCRPPNWGGAEYRNHRRKPDTFVSVMEGHTTGRSRIASEAKGKNTSDIPAEKTVAKELPTLTIRPTQFCSSARLEITIRKKIISITLLIKDAVVLLFGNTESALN